LSWLRIPGLTAYVLGKRSNRAKGVILFRAGRLFGKRGYEVDAPAERLFQTDEKRHEADRIQDGLPAHEDGFGFRPRQGWRHSGQGPNHRGQNSIR
jgi:hypothetical protein